MNTYFRLLSFLNPLPRFAIPYFIFIVCSVAFSLTTFTLLIPLLDILFNQVNNAIVPTKPEFEISVDYIKKFFNYYFILSNKEYGAKYTLAIVCATVVVSSLCANLFKYLSLRVLAKARGVIVKSIRKVIFDKIATLHLGYFSNERKGDIMARLTGDVQIVEYSIIDSMTIFFRDPLTIIAYFILLFSMSWQLTVFTLMVLPITGTMIGFISKKLKKESHDIQDASANILTVIDETISGFRIILGFNAGKFIKERFDVQNSRYADIVVRIGNIRELASPVSEVMGVSILVILLWVGGNLVIGGDSTLSASAFIAYLGIFSQILVPAKSIASAFSNIQRGLASGERIFSIIDVEPVIVNSPSATLLNSFEKEIEFRNVSFSYETDQVLNGISFKVPKGKTVALVGSSGSGKSTIIDLIPRFYDPSNGEILIDGVNIKSYTVESLRSKLGIVTQESILFNDTISNNIAFGLENTHHADIQKAAQIANAEEFILNCPEKYETNIGDRGSKLSGGQKQRLNIARAVLRNPDILLLDEATSALDSEVEKQVQAALNNLMKGRTSVIIAHRLSTIQHADEILVIQKGVIVERGTHQELILINDGVYKKLNDIQTV